MNVRDERDDKIKHKRCRGQNRVESKDGGHQILCCSEWSQRFAYGGS